MWLEEPLYRPPAEADSLIIQVSRGCPHNRCLFCGMYKGVPYKPKSFAEIKAQIQAAARAFPDAKRVFLADGDAMALPFELLKKILELLSERLPSLARASLYANGSSIAAKSDAELAALKTLKLSTLYMGLESGDEELLRLVRKGETAAGMVEAARRAQSAGLKISVMALLGLGGQALSKRHVEATAQALNAMQPKLLSFLRFVEIPGLRMYEGFKTLSEKASVAELRDLIAALELDATAIRANHASVPLPIEGRLPKDKDKLAAMLDRALNSYILDESGPGRTPLFM